ncbi:hypothetical protein C6P45_002019 [Maudiozyma exigua]|uniref:Uncharacterized protein n=1 Tax=Maudiozyma exigua TaxID=34358 RepID=A0A9P6WCY4_MAUEX|nr:hypothetical protein C6P45_002019 [Kazachstania exigua]
MNQAALNHMRVMTDLDRVTIARTYTDSEGEDYNCVNDSDSSAEQELKKPADGNRFYSELPDTYQQPHEKFFLLDKTDGFVPKKALVCKYLNNNVYQDMLQQTTDIGPTDHEDIDYNIGRKFLETGEHDPESLNDRDIDMLFDSEEDENESDDSDEGSPTAERSKTSNLNTDKNKNIFIYKSLLVGDNGFRFSGETTTTLIKGGICDCAVINVTNNKYDDLLLVVQSDGMLLSILPTKARRNRKYVDTNANSIVIQYWKLGTRDDWKIVVDQSSRKEPNFVLVNENASELKFFRYKSDREFELVNNMWFDDYKIHKCNFFLNKRNSNYSDFIGHITETSPNITTEDGKNDPFMFFVSAEYCNRIVYLCIEWIASDPFHKRVHQLPYQNGKAIIDVIPLKHNKVITFRNDSMSLLSANQIMSGETTFLTTHLPNTMKGITSWYISDVLLQKIKKLPTGQLQEYTDCIVALSATGRIFTCLISNTRVDIYPLTRFKGVEFIYPTITSSDDCEHLDFTINVKSFGRMVAIKINLEETIKSDPIVGYDNIISRKTDDVSYDSNTELAVIKDNIWLFSKSSISQVSNVLTKRGPISFLKSSDVIKTVKRFNIYTSIKVFEITEVEKWSKFLGINNSEYKISILVAKNEELIDIYLVQQTDGNNGLDNEINFEFTNLEGILENNFNTDSKALFCRPYKDFLIYVNEQRINILSITSGKCRTYKPNIPYDEIDFASGIMILWHHDPSTGSYIVSYDVTDNFEDDKNNLNFLESSYDPEPTETPTTPQKRFFIGEIMEHDVDGFFIFMFRNNVLGRVYWLRTKPRHYQKTDTVLVQDLILTNGQCVFHVDGPLLQTFGLREFGYNRYTEFPLLPTGAQTVKLRKFTSSSILAFTNDRIFVYDLRALQNADTIETTYYELKIPYQGKDSFIMDVSVQPGDNLAGNASECMIYILYSNGLKILQPSYYSEIYSNYILKYTRSKNKKFIYLKNLNRLAVINYDYNDWYCIKLENGKVLTLNNSVFEKDEALINVLDITVHSKDKGTPDDTFHFLHNMEEYMDVMYRLILTNADTDLEVELAAPFYGKGELGMFEFYEKDYGMFTDVSREKLYQYHMTYDDDTFDISLMNPVSIPSGATVIKIIPIDKESCVVAVNLSGRTDCSSKLLLFGFHYNARQHRKSGTVLKNREHISQAINEATQADHSAFEGLKKGSVPMPHYEETRPIRHEANEDIMKDCNKIFLPLSGHAIDRNIYKVEEYNQFKDMNIGDCTVGGLYQNINISSLIQDVSYDAQKRLIVVLCEDQSVLQFKAGARYMRQEDNHSSYFCDNDHELTSDVSEPRRPTAIHGYHMHHIGRYGNIWNDMKT